MIPYNLEIEKAIETIKQEHAQVVCLQLPDGLKPQAQKIQQAIEQATDATVLLWAGSNYGACDVPLGLRHLNVDLLISWGHSEWRY